MSLTTLQLWAPSYHPLSPPWLGVLFLGQEWSEALEPSPVRPLEAKDLFTPALPANAEGMGIDPARRVMPLVLAFL